MKEFASGGVKSGLHEERLSNKLLNLFQTHTFNR
jgi:hypothetical protein